MKPSIALTDHLLAVGVLLIGLVIPISLQGGTPIVPATKAVPSLPGSAVGTLEANQKGELIYVVKVVEVTEDKESADLKYVAHCFVQIVVLGDQKTKEVNLEFGVDASRHESALIKGERYTIYLARDGTFVKASPPVGPTSGPATLPGSKLSIADAADQATLIVIGKAKTLQHVEGSLGIELFTLEMVPDQALKGNAELVNYTMTVRGLNDHELAPQPEHLYIVFLREGNKREIKFLKEMEATDVNIKLVRDLLAKK